MVTPPPPRFSVIRTRDTPMPPSVPPPANVGGGAKRMFERIIGQSRGLTFDLKGTWPDGSE